MQDGQAAFPSVIAGALGEWWRSWVNLATINLVWALCWLTVVLGPPATFGAYAVASELARGRDAGFAEFTQAAKHYFGLSWAWFSSNLAVLSLTVTSLWFYANLDNSLAPFLWLLSLTLGALWLLVQFYALPYLLEQDDKRLLLAYRNALYTILAAPFYSLMLGFFALFVLGLSIVLLALLFLGGPMLIALLGTFAVRDRLRTYGITSRSLD